jgi:hypothetical protein
MTAPRELSHTKRRLLQMFELGGLPRSSRPARPVQPEAAIGIPASLAQEQVWLRDRVATPLAPLYNESITIHRNGFLNATILQESLREIVRRHEIWRTTFYEEDGRILQKVHAVPASFSLPVADLRNLPARDRENEAQRIASAQAKHAFDLTQGSLVRATLVQLSQERFRLYLTMHQIVVDGVSVYQILPLELTAIYEAFAAGLPSPLPDLSFQSSDFACRQRESMTSESMESELSYWAEELVPGSPPLQWPRTVRPPRQTYRGAIFPFVFSAELSAALRDLARSLGVTVFAVLLAGFAALLHKVTGEEDIVLGTVSPSGRKKPETQKLLGYFLNPVPLRLRMQTRQSFRSLVSQAQRTTLGAISHDDVPLEYLAERFSQQSDLSRHPFFQCVISLAPPVAPLPAGWDMTPMDAESGGARWDLYLELNDRENGMLGRAQYNPDLFQESEILELAHDFQELLKQTAQNPDRSLSSLNLAIKTIVEV